MHESDAMLLQERPDTGGFLPRKVGHDQAAYAARVAALGQPVNPVSEKRVVVAHQHQRHAGIAMGLELAQDPLKGDAVGKGRLAGPLDSDAVGHGIGKRHADFHDIACFGERAKNGMEFPLARVPGGKERQQRRPRRFKDGVSQAFRAGIRGAHGRTFWDKCNECGNPEVSSGTSAANVTAGSKCIPPGNEGILPGNEGISPSTRAERPRSSSLQPLGGWRHLF